MIADKGRHDVFTFSMQLISCYLTPPNFIQAHLAIPTLLEKNVQMSPSLAGQRACTLCGIKGMSTHTSCFLSIQEMVGFTPLAAMATPLSYLQDTVWGPLGGPEDENICNLVKFVDFKNFLSFTFGHSR